MKHREESLQSALLLHLRIQASLGTGADRHVEGLAGTHVALEAKNGPAEEGAYNDPCIWTVLMTTSSRRVVWWTCSAT